MPRSIPCRGSEVYGHTTTAMHDMSTSPPTTDRRHQAGVLPSEVAGSEGRRIPLVLIAIHLLAQFVQRL